MGRSKIGLGEQQFSVETSKPGFRRFKTRVRENELLAG